MNLTEILDLAEKQSAGNYTTESDARVALMLIAQLTRHLIAISTPAEPPPSPPQVKP